MAKLALVALCAFGGMLHAATVHRAPLKTLLIDNASVVTNVTGLGRAQVLESAQGSEWITGDGVVHRLQRRAVFNGMTAVENVTEIGEEMSWSFDWPESTGSCTLYFYPPALWMLEIIRMEDVEENGEIVQNEVVTHYEGSASWGASSVTVREGFVSHTIALETITNSVDRLALASEIPTDFAGGLTTNDVCAIVTNSSPGGFSEWTITLDLPQNDWLSDADREMFKAYVANSTVTWHEEINGAGLYWYFRPGGPFTGSESVWFLPPTDVFDLDENATDITFCIAAERDSPGRWVDVRATREKLPKGNVLGLAMAKDVISAEAVTNIVRDVSNSFWDEKNAVLWRLDFRDGEPMFLPVTNVNVKAGGAK